MKDDKHGSVMIDFKDQEFLNYMDKELFKPPITPIKQKSIISFDCETTSKANDFFLCGFIDCNDEYKVFFDKLEALKYILRIKNGKLLYATNLSFDFNTLASGTDIKNRCEFIQSGGRMIQVKIKGSYGNVKLLDSINYGGLSVEKMGKILGKPKLKHPKCFGRKPKSKKELEELLRYNEQDCRVTKEFMELLQKGLNDLGGELKITIGSCAMDLYKRRFLKDIILRENMLLEEDVKSKIFKAYYGGRTECFKRGRVDKLIFCGDVNSLYPSVMLNKYPNPNSVKVFSGEDRSLLKYMGVSFFRLNIPYTKYPLLPYRRDGKLLFPIGRFEGYYTHLEINKAIQLYGKNIIMEMKDTVYYTEEKYYFNDFVETIYNLRLEYQKTNNPLEVIMKLLLNNLYGKFGQRHLSNIEYFFAESDNTILELIKNTFDCGKKIYVNNVNEGYIIEESEYDGNYSLPIWSVYVTAYARIKLHSLILEYEPYYVDTDSVYTDKIIIGCKELGMLKLEKKMNKCIFVKPKLYFPEDEIKSKGVPIPRSARNKIRLINNILEEKEIKYEKFIKEKEGIRHNLKINSMTVMSKHINLQDEKRDWLGKRFDRADLQDSEPLIIREDDIINNKYVTQSMRDKATVFYNKKKRREKEDFMKSDLFDSYSMNEEGYDKQVRGELDE
jgi:hypothetical protein